MIQTILKSVDLEHCKGRHTLHIWLTTPNKLKGISPFQMRKFLILFFNPLYMHPETSYLLCSYHIFSKHLTVSPKERWNVQFYSKWQNVLNLKYFISHDVLTILKFLWQQTTSKNNFTIWNATSVKLANKSNCITWPRACNFFFFFLIAIWLLNSSKR